MIEYGIISSLNSGSVLCGLIRLRNGEHVFFNFEDGYKLSMNKKGGQLEFNLETQVTRYPREGEKVVFVRSPKGGNQRYAKAKLWGYYNDIKNKEECLQSKVVVIVAIG